MWYHHHCLTEFIVGYLVSYSKTRGRKRRKDHSSPAIIFSSLLLVPKEGVRTFFLAFSQHDDIFILCLCLTVAKLADPGTHVWSTPWTDHTAISASQEVVNAHED